MTSNNQNAEAIASAKSKILKIAAELVSGSNYPSPYCEDHVWPKTTPKGAIRKAMKAFGDTRRHAFNQGHELRKVYDELSAITKPQPPTEDARDALVEAAQAVVDRWDTPLWKAEPTSHFIAKLRQALAQHGEVKK